MGFTALATGYTGTVDPLNVILVEASTGNVLYAKDVDTAAYSSGLVKLMTAYVTIQNAPDLNAEVTVSSNAF